MRGCGGVTFVSLPGPALPMIDRALAEAVLREVIAACDPATRVREALRAPEVAARLAGRRRFAFAVGKAALAMAQGAGEVVAGIAVVPAGAGGALPRGWRLLEAAHPVPDERSVAAGLALQAFVRAPRGSDVLLALISGGASALAEVPAIALAELVATIRGVMAAGAAIEEINTVRGALSAIKAGQLAREASAPSVPSPARPDHAAVIAPMRSAADAAARALAARGIAATLLEAPIAGDVEAVARTLATPAAR